MKILAPFVLTVVASVSIAVAATARRPVPLPSKSCCDDCTVARYRPEGVPVAAATMVHGALAREAMLLLGTVGLVLAARRTPRPPSQPQPVPQEALPAGS